MKIIGRHVLLQPAGTKVKVVDPNHFGCVLEVRYKIPKVLQKGLYEKGYGFWGDSIDTYVFEIINKRRMFNENN